MLNPCSWRMVLIFTTAFVPCGYSGPGTNINSTLFILSAARRFSSLSSITFLLFIYTSGAPLPFTLMPSAAVSMKGNCPSAIIPLAYLLRFVFSTKKVILPSTVFDVGRLPTTDTSPTLYVISCSVIFAKESVCCMYTGEYPRPDIFIMQLLSFACFRMKVPSSLVVVPLINEESGNDNNETVKYSIG